MIKETNPNEKEYRDGELYRCRNCKTIVKGNVGVCPRCGILQEKNNFEHLVEKETIVRALNEKEILVKKSKIFGNISLIVGLVIGILLCWIPYIGIGLTAISAIFSLVVLIKFREVEEKRNAIAGVLVSVVGLLLAIILSVTFGKELWGILF